MHKRVDNIIRTSTGVNSFIYHDACAYLRAAQYIKKYETSFPYSTNLAFSIELFIKSIHVTNTIEFDPDNNHAMVSRSIDVHARISGHSLLKMFHKLPQSIFL